MEHKATYRSAEENKKLLLNASMRLFLQKGYTATTLRAIAQEAGVNIGSLMYLYTNKEALLADLVESVLDAQLKLTSRLLEGVTEDKVLYWATERTLQLHIAESSEVMREMYLAAYSMAKPSAVIYQWMSSKLEVVFSECFPQYQPKEFYELEIASGGIIRSFMSIRCDLYFDMKRKVRRYLESTLRIYKMPEHRVAEICQFIAGIDFSDAPAQLMALLQQSYSETKEN